MMLNSGVSLVALDLMLLRFKISGCQLPFVFLDFFKIFFSKSNCATTKKDIEV